MTWERIQKIEEKELVADSALDLLRDLSQHYLCALDFDGVLNNKRTKQRLEGFIGLDPKNMAHLNALCERVPNLLIIVSSTWRLNRTTTDLQSLLGDHGFKFPDRIVGRTPNWFSEKTQQIYGVGRVTGGRGFEIQEWINTFAGTPPKALVILDDDSDMAHLKPRLVQTDFDRGLGVEHVEQVIRMLEAT